MMRSSLDIASLNEFQFRLSVRNGCCKNSWMKSKMHCKNLWVREISFLQSSKWRKQENHWKAGWKSYRLRSARMMLSRLNSLALIDCLLMRRTLTRISFYIRKCVTLLDYRRVKRKNLLTCIWNVNTWTSWLVKKELYLQQELQSRTAWQNCIRWCDIFSILRFRNVDWPSLMHGHPRLAKQWQQANWLRRELAIARRLAFPSFSTSRNWWICLSR